MSINSVQIEVSRLQDDGQYHEALQLISSKISCTANNPELFLLRAQNLLKLDKFKEAKTDAAKAIELGAGWEAHLVHGKALFNLGEYQESLNTFSKGKEKAGSTTGQLDQFGQWTTWCEERIKKLGLNSTCSENKMAEKPSDAQKDSGSTMPVPKIKHDWYQTDSHVVVTVLIKNQKKEDVKIDFTDKTLSVRAPLPSGSEYSLELDLCHPISPDQCSYKVVPSKIEIKMKKVDGLRWNTLEGDGTSPSVKVGLSGDPTKSDKIPSYPTSASKKHDWNKLEAEVKKEEEDEKMEGDAALNQLFQKIYGEGNEETRRAMNKSFMESGGTVLSTNWNEVAAKKVDIKPPDGMEYKKWN